MNELQEENTRQRAVIERMLEALLNVRAIISEASMTGFNYKDGDWPERLFASQAVTSAAIAKALGRHQCRTCGVWLTDADTIDCSVPGCGVER
jgi:hypothetical protein